MTPDSRTGVHPLAWCVQVRQLTAWMKRSGVPTVEEALRRLSDRARVAGSGSAQGEFFDMMEKN